VTGTACAGIGYYFFLFFVINGGEGEYIYKLPSCTQGGYIGNSESGGILLIGKERSDDEERSEE